MIKRIVRLCFKEEFTDDFEAIFTKSKSEIRASKGCLHLELCKDLYDKRIYFTISFWENEDALQMYRNSELFVETWASTKKLFEEKPMAFSLLPFQTVESDDINRH